MTEDTERYRVWLAELVLAPTAPITSISAVRRCAECDRRLRKSARVDAITCSKRCRQKRWREKTRNESRKVSRRVPVARHVLTQSARNRAAFDLDAVPSHVPTEIPSKRVLSIVRTRGAEVHID